MQLLIKNGTILNPSGAFHQEKVDILIQNGTIADIRSTLEVEKAEVIDASEGYISIGWMDIGVQTGDPGFEHREDLDSVTKAAAAGGYTAIASFPNTNPVIHSKSEVRYIKHHTQGNLVDVYPIGAISQNCEGKDITEMYDMSQAGAVAFSDGSKPVQHAGLLLRALQYVKAFNSLIINHPHDKTAAPGGQMHEGRMSTSLGLKGIPALSEELMVQRDLELLKYTDSKLHILNVSTAGAVERIRQAKEQGLNVTASVAILNLTHNDEALYDFNVNLKLLPPLREENDRLALLAGLQDGTIDCITSNHIPLEEEAKKLEFPYADFGATGLETAFALYQMYLKDTVTLEQWIEKVAIQPRKLLQLSIPELKTGVSANLTVFQPNAQWTYDQNSTYSKSYNSPFFNQQVTGKIQAVINHNRHLIWPSK